LFVLATLEIELLSRRVGVEMADVFATFSRRVTRMKSRLPFKSRKLAVATAVAMVASIGTAAALIGITTFVTTNLVTNTDETLTFVYPTTSPSGNATDANGLIVIDEKEDVVAPGIDVYSQDFTTGGTAFQGCIMASKNLAAVPPPALCSGDPDSGKRFKLRSTKINQPMDLQFSVDMAGQASPLLFNVYGKLTNETGFPAKGFKVELGTGIGADFVPSTETDGLTLKGLDNKPALGKFPGGLFGGSPAEGLPFFTTTAARFLKMQDGDSFTTTGVPAEYLTLFNDWQTLDDVPEAWFFDIDGKPWTDDKLLAWKAADGKWYTMQKDWNLPTMLLGIDLGANPLPLELDPALTPFIDVTELTAWLNTTGGFTGSAVLKVQEVVGEMVTYVTLTQTEVVDGFSGWFGTGDPTIWAANPVTVQYSMDPGLDNPQTSVGPVVATWDPTCGDEGLYRLAAGYQNYPEIAAIATTDSVCGAVAEANAMSPVVRDNTSARTNFFGIPGYSQGVIEDLSNVNNFFAVELAPAASIGRFTMRVTVQGDDPVTPPVLPPVTPPTTTVGGSGGGCTVASGSAPIDPTLPLLAALGLAGWGLRRARRS